MLGVRRSYFDVLADPFVRDDIPLPSYLDAQVRASWGDPRRAGRIIPQVFTSIDRVASDDISLTSAFVRAGVTYRKTWGPTHLEVVPWAGWNGLLLHSEVKSDGPDEPGDDTGDDTGDEEEELADFRRPTYVMGVRADLVRDFSWGHLRGGLDAQGGHLGQISIEVNDLMADVATSMWWGDVAGYLEARWVGVDERLAFKPGVRVERYGGTGEWVADPRLNFSQRITERLSLRQAIGRFHQQPTPMELEPTLGNTHLVSGFTDQLSLGLEARLPRGVDASLTGFWHYGRRQPTAAIRPGPDPDVPEPNTGGLGPIFQELLEEQFGTFEYREATGRARSRGVELSVRYRSERVLGFLGYTLARAERTDDPTRFTGWHPYQLDQTHHLTAVGSIGLTHWRFGARLTVVSGNPYSPFLGYGEDGEARYDKFASRLPAHVTLDVRADRAWRRKWGEVVLYFDIQNATNRDNVEGRELDGDMQADIPGLPIVPFVGVEVLPRP
jgi:outer membrane receptor protein involved in Fe transport